MKHKQQAAALASWLILGSALLLVAPSAHAQTIPPEPGRAVELRDEKAYAKIVSDFLRDPKRPEAVRTLELIASGDLRGAFRQAHDLWTRASEDDLRRLDANLLEGAIFAKANCWLLAHTRWERASEIDPDNRGVKVLRKLLDARKMGAHTNGLAASHSKPPANAPSVFFMLEHADVPAAHVASFDIFYDDIYQGTLAVELITMSNHRKYFVTNFYDLEGSPLRVSMSATEPAAEHLTALAERITPGLGKGRYTLMRAELEALCAHEQGITPFAAFWAQYARTELVDNEVIKPLRAQRALYWSRSTTLELGPWQPYGFYMVGYLNDSAQADDPNIRGPLEHQHYVVFSRNPRVYLGSYVVASDEPAPGERLYFLKRIVQGSSQVLTSYAASPRPDDVVAQVRKYLQDSPPSFLATKSPIRIEDRITPDDERDASGQKHPSKTYAFQMASGVRYVINLTSTDFDAYLRLKDDQGVELARDDDSGGDLNAQITFQAPKDGIYRVVATSFNGKTGHFALTVGTEGRSPAAANVLRGPVRMEQELTANDATGAAIVGRGYRKTFSYQMTAGRKYVIDMVSNDFDSYLRLNDDQGKEVDHDDDSGGFPHARITYRAPRDGVYEIIATTFDGGKTGRFTLSVREES